MNLQNFIIIDKAFLKKIGKYCLLSEPVLAKFEDDRIRIFFNDAPNFTMASIVKFYKKDLVDLSIGSLIQSTFSMKQLISRIEPLKKSSSANLMLKINENNLLIEETNKKLEIPLLELTVKKYSIKHHEESSLTLDAEYFLDLFSFFDSEKYLEFKCLPDSILLRAESKEGITSNAELLRNNCFTFYDSPKMDLKINLSVESLKKICSIIQKSTKTVKLSFNDQSFIMTLYDDQNIEAEYLLTTLFL